MTFWKTRSVKLKCRDLKLQQTEGKKYAAFTFSNLNSFLLFGSSLPLILLFFVKLFSEVVQGKVRISICVVFVCIMNSIVMYFYMWLLWRDLNVTYIYCSYCLFLNTRFACIWVMLLPSPKSTVTINCPAAAHKPTAVGWQDSSQLTELHHFLYK